MEGNDYVQALARVALWVAVLVACVLLRGGWRLRCLGKLAGTPGFGRRVLDRLAARRRSRGSR